MENSQANILRHVVAIPYPAQGHINPLLQLCHQLVPHGFTFTFVNTHHIQQRLNSAEGRSNGRRNSTRDNPDLVHDVQHANSHAHTSQGEDDHWSLDQEGHAIGLPHIDEGENTVQTLPDGNKAFCNPIRMVSIEGGCPPEKHARHASAPEALIAAQNMQEHVEQLLSDIMEEQSVAFILTDILLGWSSATASRFGLPWVCFWAASAASFSTFNYFADLAREGKHIPIAENQLNGKVTVIDDIPGLPPTLLHEMHKLWDDAGRPAHRSLKYFQMANRASCLLLNTFAELEEQVLQAISTRYPTLAVGPLLPLHYMNEDILTCPDKNADSHPLHRPSLFREDRACLNWLDRQAPSSVLFISFGSISARTPEQLEELAQGVAASGCPFLWVQRPGICSVSTPEIGVGVQRGINGLVVPWAPQLDVLSHPAVGGFITHCGWNSIMESVAMGVPMLCWADTGERLSNQRFAVQFWKSGMEMVSDSRRYSQHIDEGAVLVRRQEIEKSIRCLMVEEAGAPIRARAAHLRNAAILAFRNSSSQFGRLVHVLAKEAPMIQT